MRRWGGAFAALVGLLVASPAAAYKLYDTSAKGGSGTPLRWFTGPVTVVFDSQPPEGITLEVATQQVTESFKVWSALSCAGDLVPFTFVFGGTVTGRQVGYDFDAGAGNENLVRWVRSASEWSYGPGVLALTSLTYDTCSGEIVDADLEFNDAEFTFSAAAEVKKVDIRNTTVHECGHVLGLDHSESASATMYARAPLGETKKRTLDQDDVDGYCALYGPSAPARQPCASSGGTQASDCGVAAPGGGAPTVPLGLAVLLGVLLASARRRAA